VIVVVFRVRRRAVHMIAVPRPGLLFAPLQIVAQCGGKAPRANIGWLILCLPGCPSPVVFTHREILPEKPGGVARFAAPPESGR
jgi:hypothetical protein